MSSIKRLFTCTALLLAASASAADCLLLDAAGQPYSGAEWSGACKDGRADGAGSAAFANGDVLKGSAANGRVAGIVTLEYRNGDRYEGGWNGARHGQGKMVFAYGGQYEGGWDGGMPQGQGMITYPNGATVSGVFHGSFQAGKAAAPAPQSSQRYTLDGPKVTGSNVRFVLARNFPVPPARAYYQLTAQQQAIVKQSYPILQDADEPPYPLNGHNKMAEELARVLNRLNARGVIRFTVDIDEQGKPVSVSVLRAPSEWAREYVGKIALVNRYKPAVCAGKPCAMTLALEYDFSEPEN
jgi:hypothetical protein